MPTEPRPTETLTRLRRWLLWIFLGGSLGTTAELFLLDHTEGFWQWTPIVLLGAAVLATLWTQIAGSIWSQRVVSGVLVVVTLSGLVGTFQHYRGNLEFELEIFPSLAGWELFWRTLKGATPTLAPGAMILLGLLGLLAQSRRLGWGKAEGTRNKAGAGTKEGE
ncbi:MAG: hypothetical protein K0U98_06295 [Deltaproteobacteria bacterium]|nr:hypothetical protein [Deltaproteobacteria bacterium]